jgi:hypothetical protein
MTVRLGSHEVVLADTREFHFSWQMVDANRVLWAWGILSTFIQINARLEAIANPAVSTEAGINAVRKITALRLWDTEIWIYGVARTGASLESSATTKR